MTTPELPKGFFSVERGGDGGTAFVRQSAVNTVQSRWDGGTAIIALNEIITTAEPIDSVLRKIAAAQAEEA